MPVCDLDSSPPSSSIALDSSSDESSRRRHKPKYNRLVSILRKHIASPRDRHRLSRHSPVVHTRRDERKSSKRAQRIRETLLALRGQLPNAILTRSEERRRFSNEVGDGIGLRGSDYHSTRKAFHENSRCRYTRDGRGHVIIEDNGRSHEADYAQEKELERYFAEMRDHNDKHHGFIGRDFTQVYGRGLSSDLEPGHPPKPPCFCTYCAAVIAVDTDYNGYL